MGLSLSQFVLASQFAPSVLWYKATSTARSEADCARVGVAVGVGVAAPQSGRLSSYKIILRYISQPLGYAPGQLVAVENQLRQVGQAAQLRRNLAVNWLSRESTADVRLDRSAQLRRNLARQLVVWRSSSQVGQAAQLRRNLARQLVVAEVQPRQVGQAAQLRRCLARQRVAAESSSSVRLDRPPSSGGISPVNWLAPEVQQLAGWTGPPAQAESRPSTGVRKATAVQVGQAAQLRRNLAHQLVGP